MNPRQRTYYFFFLGFMILTNESIAFNSSSSNNCNGSKKPTAFSRRNFMDKIATTFVSIGSLTILETMEAATNKNDLVAFAADGQSTIWRSGKTPIVPSQKPKNPNDVKGTRKDSSFLRSIAQCKNGCESRLGPDGLALSKEECLQECQDVCCKTYEQCTFAIVPRI